MKRAPTYSLGDYHIRYIQVPYDNRYFVIRRNTWFEVCRISSANSTIVSLLVVGFILKHYYSQKEHLTFDEVLQTPMYSRWLKFLDRVALRDEYLDRDD